MKAQNESEKLDVKERKKKLRISPKGDLICITKQTNREKKNDLSFFVV